MKTKELAKAHDLVAVIDRFALRLATFSVTSGRSRTTTPLSHGPLSESTGSG
jgi:hypothetical protein